MFNDKTNHRVGYLIFNSKPLTIVKSFWNFYLIMDWALNLNLYLTSPDFLSNVYLCSQLHSLNGSDKRVQKWKLGTNESYRTNVAQWAYQITKENEFKHIIFLGINCSSFNWNLIVGSLKFRINTLTLLWIQTTYFYSFHYFQTFTYLHFISLCAHLLNEL